MFPWCSAIFSALLASASARAAEPKDLVRTAQAVVDDAGGRHALLIGVDQYDDPAIADLSFAGLDAHRMAEVLISSGAWLRENVVVMTPSEPETKLHPTRANVLEQLRALQARAGAEAVLVYFSGHGSAAGTRGFEKNYLYPSDARLTIPEDTAITEERVRELVEGIDAPRKLLVMDACRNQLEKATKGLPAAWLEPRYTAAEGTWILYSTDFGSYSYEDEGARLGAMTRYLAEALEGAADGAADGVPDGVVSFAEAVPYVTRKLGSPGGGRPPQVPMVQESRNGGDFAITPSVLVRQVEGPACPWSASVLRMQADQVIAAWKEGDHLEFQARATMLSNGLSCAGEPLSGAAAASVHRVHALQCYSYRDAAGTVLALQAVSQSQPGRPVLDGIPGAEPALQGLATEAAARSDGEWRRERTPGGTHLWVDGQLARGRPVERPAVVQVVNCDDTVQWSGWLPGNAPLPAVNAGSGVVCRRPLRTGLAVGASLSLAASGGLLAGGMLARAEWEKVVHKGGMTGDEIERAKELDSKADGLGTAALVTGGIAAGLGVGLVVAF